MPPRRLSRGRLAGDVPAILVLRALGLGDFLTAVPALRGLRAAYPRDRIILAAPAWLQPVVRMSAAVDELLPTEAQQPIGFESPALAVNLHGRGPESHRLLLATRPARLIAFENFEVPESAGMPVWRPDDHEVWRWCRLLEESGIATDPDRLDLPNRHVPNNGATVIHPGASAASRRWPATRWAAVARHERNRGRQVVVTAGPGEDELAARVAAAAGLPASAVFRGHDLDSLVRLVAGTGRVLSGDTGVAHLATALGRPSVVLFGPVSPAHWGPPLKRSLHRVLWTGRTGRPNASVVDQGLLEISTERVLAALEGLP